MQVFDTADAYGLPAGILGIHPDEFYGAIGRVVCVCAVLEDRVTTLRHTLAHAEQGKFTHQPVSTQIDVAERMTEALPELDGRQVRDFLTAARAAFQHRNDLVHSSFPAQPDGRIWGYRPTREKSVTDGTADTVETSLDNLRGFVVQLADLVNSFNQVHAVAGVHRKL